MTKGRKKIPTKLKELRGTTRPDRMVENEMVVLTFSDTGSGIKEENLTKVFEPFFTTKEQGKGTGLGLWISYGIVKSFQGDLKVKSTQKKGTRRMGKCRKRRCKNPK